MLAVALTVTIAGADIVSKAPSLHADVAVQSPPKSSRTPVVSQSTGSHYAIVTERQQEDDDGPNVLLMALLTTGVAAGAAVLGLIGYVIRNRIGFWLHRPPPREGGPPQEHH